MRVAAKKALDPDDENINVVLTLDALFPYTSIFHGDCSVSFKRIMLDRLCEFINEIVKFAFCKPRIAPLILLTIDQNDQVTHAAHDTDLALNLV